MAKGYDSYLTIYDNDGWSSTGTDYPIVPIIESESLNAGIIIGERTSMVRSTRSHLDDSRISDGEAKPEGALEVIPRFETLPSILRSHFQVLTSQTATGSSWTQTYEPLQTTPLYSEGSAFGTGAYGATAADVYSIDIKKSITGGASSGHDVVHFQRGVCDKLTFSSQPNEDFKIKADFKFKGVDFLNTTSVFGDSDVGGYSTGSISDWSHGTWVVALLGPEGDFIPDNASAFEIECSNNITEKKTMGAKNRTSFNWGNYTVKGRFTTEYLDDTFYETYRDTVFEIHGTMWNSSTEFLAIDLPRVRIKPFNKNMGKPEEFLEAEVEFEAYESGGNAPITVTVHYQTNHDYYDADPNSRSLPSYDFADAGSTSRTLSEYDFADRDKI